jgi:signal transduction histidine kinase
VIPSETRTVARDRSAAPGIGRHVLLVDDDPLVLRLMNARLVAAGFSVGTAGGVSEALDAARLARPDVIMSDVRMTELDGFMLCSVFRSDPELGAIPIMLVTGAVEEDDHKLAVSVGAQALVERSASFERELAALFRVLGIGGSTAVAAPSWQPEPYVRRIANQMARLVAELSVRNGELQCVVNDQQRLQASLELAKDDALQESRMKDQFLMTLSHELRTPLNVIYGRTRMLRDHSVVDRDKALDIIEQQTVLQIRLVDGLLDLSQMITGRLRIERQWVSVQSLVLDAVAALQPSADAKGVALSASAAEGLTVFADPVRMQQILRNLLVNAIQFTARDGQVDVVGTSTDDSVSIVVRDTGIGMPEEFLPHAFDHFRQADQATTRGHGGMGLGLAIVRHLTELHGGTVSVTSKPGLGSNFLVLLPIGSTATPIQEG